MTNIEKMTPSERDRQRKRKLAIAAYVKARRLTTTKCKAVSIAADVAGLSESTVRNIIKEEGLPA